MRYRQGMPADYEFHQLITPRLELRLITPKQLQALADGTFQNSSLAHLGFTNPHSVLVEGPSPVRWRAPQVQQDISLNRWFIRWIIEKSSQQVVGSISFHAPPDETGMIEVGLGVAGPCQNRGYAKEALKAMWDWVVDQPNVQTLRYTVSPDNAPSIAIIKHFGFDYVGQQIDPEDGPEDIYEMSAEMWKSNFLRMD